MESKITDFNKQSQKLEEELEQERHILRQQQEAEQDVSRFVNKHLDDIAQRAHHSKDNQLLNNLGELNQNLQRSKNVYLNELEQNYQTKQTKIKEQLSDLEEQILVEKRKEDG